VNLAGDEVFTTGLAWLAFTPRSRRSAATDASTTLPWTIGPNLTV
jgi:hypothetical protein